MSKAFLLVVAASSALSVYSNGAEPFSNLDFEQAVVKIQSPSSLGPPGSGFGFISDLLPAWDVYTGKTFGSRTLNGPRTSTAIGYNLPFFEFTGPPYLSLRGPTPPPPGGSSPGQDLFDIAAIPDKTEGSYWLSQRGDIPADARSVTAAGGGFNVWVDGVKAAQAGTLFDVSAYAGRNAELTFEMFALPLVGPPGGIFEHQFSVLDDIRFSSEAIPEPSTIWFWLSAGSVFFFCWRWKGIPPARAA